MGIAPPSGPIILQPLTAPLPQLSPRAATAMFMAKGWSQTPLRSGLPSSAFGTGPAPRILTANARMIEYLSQLTCSFYERDRVESMPFVACQKPLHFNGCHAARARGGNRLAVVPVLDVAGVKDSFEIGPRAAF